MTLYRDALTSSRDEGDGDVVPSLLLTFDRIFASITYTLDSFSIEREANYTRGDS